MEFLQERDVEDGKTGADSKPEGHGDKAKDHDDPAIVVLAI
jgi:hypothetical protein